MTGWTVHAARPGDRAAILKFVTAICRTDAGRLVYADAFGGL